MRVAKDSGGKFARIVRVVIAGALFAAITTLFVMDRPLAPASAAESSGDDEAGRASHASGRRLYDANCAVCHGAEGDGRGPAATMFLTRPRDFRDGIFKFRSTPSGSLPTDEDLDRTIRHGLRWTAMIARADLSEAERRALVQYIRTFSSKFAKERPMPAIRVPRQPERTAQFISEGEKLFRAADCVSCHGTLGRGDGPNAADMKDDWGWPIRPGDLSWRPLKRGSSLEQIYLTIATGISGTPMPAFGDSIDPAQIWALVYFLETLVPAERRLPPERWLGEEQQGRMALHMGGMMGRSRGPFR